MKNKLLISIDSMFKVYLSIINKYKKICIYIIDYPKGE